MLNADGLPLQTYLIRRSRALIHIKLLLPTILFKKVIEKKTASTMIYRSLTKARLCLAIQQTKVVSFDC